MARRRTALAVVRKKKIKSSVYTRYIYTRNGYLSRQRDTHLFAAVSSRITVWQIIEYSGMAPGIGCEWARLRARLDDALDGQLGRGHRLRRAAYRHRGRTGGVVFLQVDLCARLHTQRLEHRGEW